MTDCPYPKVACDILATIPPERKKAFEQMEFIKGAGRGVSGYCAEEGLAFLMGEPITDASPCTCPVIRTGTIRVNDSYVWANNAERTEALRGLVFAQIGSRSTPQVEEARRLLAVRFAFHVAAPFWLRRAGMDKHAARMERAVITAETLPLARKVAQDVRDAAAAAAAAVAVAAAVAADAAAVAAVAAAVAAVAADAAAVAVDAAAAVAAAVAADAAVDVDVAAYAKPLVIQYIAVLRAMCDVTPESAATILATDDSVVGV